MKAADSLIHGARFQRGRRVFGGCAHADSKHAVRGFKEKPMKTNFRWLIRAGLVGLLISSAAVLAIGQTGNPAATTKKKMSAQHRQEVKDQKNRIKQSRRDVRAEVRLTDHHASPPKATRHKMVKVQRHTGKENPNLRSARKESRSRRVKHHVTQPQ